MAYQDTMTPEALNAHRHDAKMRMRALRARRRQTAEGIAIEQEQRARFEAARRADPEFQFKQMVRALAQDYPLGPHCIDCGWKPGESTAVPNCRLERAHRYYSLTQPWAFDTKCVACHNRTDRGYTKKLRQVSA